MAKSARSSQIKTNNQKLKKNVFGPVEEARTARLSARLLELASQPKPQKDVEMEVADAADESKTETTDKTEAMEVDAGAKSTTKGKTGKRIARSGIAKRKAKKSLIVFPKYGESRNLRGKKN